jgi:tetratricopeptide (TPR) repeat protein
MEQVAQAAAPRPRLGVPAGAAVAALVVATVLAYVPALRGGFIWDDDLYIVANRFLEEPGGLAEIWTGSTIHQYYPLTFTTFWIERRLWGVEPFGYHAVNVALHVANALLVGRLLGRLAVPGAWFIAALFALHPVHVESVAWAMERKNVLSGFFYLLAFAAYLRFAERRAVRWYGAAMGLFVAALLSKTVTATFPVAVFLALWYRQRRPPWSELRPLAPFVAVGLGFAGLTVWLERVNVGATGSDFALGFGERALLAARIFLFYAYKLLLPLRLTFVYPRWTIDATAPAQYLPLVGVALVAAGVLVLHRRVGPGPLAAVGFYGATIFPALGFFNVYPFVFSYVADHFQYLASLGILALVPAAAAAAGRRVLARDQARRRLGHVVGAGVLVVLGTLTWRQGWIYRDEETLWRDTLAKNPDAWIAHNNLGVIVAEQGKHAEGIAHYRRVIALRPQYGTAYANLANALVAEGQVAEAVALYEQAARLEPENARTQHVLGLLLVERGRLADAARHLEAAVRAAPDEQPPRGHLAHVLSELGRHDEAIAQYEAALALDPEDVSLRYDFAVELAAAGRGEEAVAQYRAVIRRDPRHADAHNNLAVTLAAQGRTNAALAHYRAALASAPDDEVVRLNLARLFMRLGWAEEVLELLREGMARAPQSGRLANALGWYLATLPAANLRDGAEAVRLAELAVRQAPGDDPNLLDTLAAAYAEAGRFEDAVRTADRARELAATGGQSGLASTLEERLALYRKGEPYREAPATDAIAE